jgi:actin-related protein 5
LKDVFLTGGNTLFTGFDERFRKEVRGFLPIDATLNVRKASDPVFDAWKGAAQWASGGDLGRSSVTRQEYMEKGSEYIKEHDLGNATW